MRKLAFVTMFLGCVACGDNIKPEAPALDCWSWPDPICPLPPADQMEDEEECYFECTPVGRGRQKTWRCTEICECE